MVNHLSDIMYTNTMYLFKCLHQSWECKNK